MSGRLQLEVGITALELVTKLPQINPRIRTLLLKTYAPMATLEERLAISTDLSSRKIFEQAEERRKADPQLAYWESILAVSSGVAESHLLIKKAIEHETSNEAFERFELTEDELRNGTLQTKLTSLSGDIAIALCSTCKIKDDGSTMHLPMMDFRAEANESNLNRLKAALKEIVPSQGAILESGRSYHYIGFSLLTEDEWLKFLAKCLLLAPLTDTRYIAHRILEGVGSLRISGCKLKPMVPHAVDFL